MKKWIIDGKFNELSEDEVKGLSTEELGEYTSAKHKNDSDSLITDFEKKLADLAEIMKSVQEAKAARAKFEANVKIKATPAAKDAYKAQDFHMILYIDEDDVGMWRVCKIENGRQTCSVPQVISLP